MQVYEIRIRLFIIRLSGLHPPPQPHNCPKIGGGGTHFDIRLNNMRLECIFKRMTVTYSIYF